MSLTTTGLGLIGVGVALVFVKRPEPLLYALAFFSHFGATSIVNVPDVMGGRGVEPWVLFASCVVLRAMLGARREKLRATWRSWSAIGVVLVLAAVAAAAVVGAGMVTSGGVFADADADAPGRTVQREGGINVRQVTQTLYWFVGGSVVVFGSVMLKSGPSVERFIMAFVWGAVFSTAWGFLQWLAAWAGFEWPWWIFNQSVSPYAQGWRQIAAPGSLPRVSGTAPEPSMFAAGVVTAAAALIFRRGETAKLWLGSVLAASAMLSTSTTGIVGGAVLVAAAAWLAVMRSAMSGRLAVKWLGAVCVGLATGGIVAAVAFSDDLDVVVREHLLEKYGTLSYVDRLTSMGLALEGAWESPIVGWGPGAFLGRSLATWLLANTGVLGVAAFILFVGCAHVDCWTAWTRGMRQQVISAVAMMWAVVAGGVVSGVYFSQGFFWIPFVAAASLGGCRGDRSREERGRERGNVV